MDVSLGELLLMTYDDLMLALIKALIVGLAIYISAVGRL